MNPEKLDVAALVASAAQQARDDAFALARKAYMEQRTMDAMAWTERVNAAAQQGEVNGRAAQRESDAKVAENVAEKLGYSAAEAIRANVTPADAQYIESHRMPQMACGAHFVPDCASCDMDDDRMHAFIERVMQQATGQAFQTFLHDVLLLLKYKPGQDELIGMATIHTAIERVRAEAALEVSDELAAPYPEDVFTPLTHEERMNIVDAITRVVRGGCDRLHADWARHWAKAIRERIAQLSQQAGKKP